MVAHGCLDTFLSLVRMRCSIITYNVGTIKLLRRREHIVREFRRSHLSGLQSTRIQGLEEALASHATATPTAILSSLSSPPEMLSSPPEMWRQLMDATWQFSTGRAGIGNPHFRGLFRQLLVSIRTHQRVPAVWNVSATTELSKHNGKRGCPSIRRINTLDSVGKAFYSAWEMHDMTTVCETTRVVNVVLSFLHTVRTFPSY